MYLLAKACPNHWWHGKGKNGNNLGQSFEFQFLTNFYFELHMCSHTHSTMDELEKHDGDVAHVIHVALERVQDLQNGEGIDEVAPKV